MMLCTLAAAELDQWRECDVACGPVSLLQPTPPAHALLTAGDPIKNASAILRYALPIDNKPIRKVQVGPAAATAGSNQVSCFGSTHHCLERPQGQWLC
jgi:hypothetical protein